MNKILRGFATAIDDSGLGVACSTTDLKCWHAGRTVRVFELNGQDRDAANPYGAATNVNIRENRVPMERMPLTYSFPAHSATILELSAVN